MCPTIRKRGTVMSTKFDEQAVVIICPTCGKECQTTVGWIKTHDLYVCPQYHVMSLEADPIHMRGPFFGHFLEALAHADARIETPLA